MNTCRKPHKNKWKGKNKHIKVVYYFSQGCYNEALQTGCLKATEMYSLSVLESRSSKSRCQQFWLLLRGPKENLFHSSLLSSVMLGDPWLVAAALPSASIVTCILSQGPLFLQRTSCWMKGLLQFSMVSCQIITSATTLFSNKITFWGARGQDINIPLGRHNSVHNKQL